VKDYIIRIIYLIYLILDQLILLIFVLLNVAFVTLLERKILGYRQNRVGPNKPSLIGIFQPIADAIKLFTKNFIISNKTIKTIFYIRPALSLILVL